MTDSVVLFSLLDLSDRQMEFLIKLFVVLLCLPVHEMAHAFTAWKLGDPTGKEAGRLTLNPFKHLDPLGAAMIFFVGFGYAKPVPVNIRKFKNPKVGFAITAVAGPLSNLIMAFISLGILRIMYLIEGTSVDVLILSSYIFPTVAFINIALAIFNLIPVPPLDGSRVIMAFLPDKAYVKLLQNERYLMIALFAAMFVLGEAGYSPISFLAEKVYGLMTMLLFGA